MLLWLAIILGGATFVLLVLWIMLMDPAPSPTLHDPPHNVTVLPRLYDQDSDRT